MSATGRLCLIAVIHYILKVMNEISIILNCQRRAQDIRSTKELNMYPTAKALNQVNRGCSL